MRKKVISVLLAGLLAIGLTGCQGSGEPKKEGPAQQSDSSGDKVPVKLVVWSSGAAENFQKGADVFNSRQDEIDFQVEMQTGDYNQYLGAKVASDDLPDLFFLNPYSQVQQFAENDRILDLSDQAFSSKIYDSVKDAYSYDGKSYAYPMCLEMLGIYYNVDLFEEAGITQIPKTFAQMEEVCAKLKEKNITPFAATYKDGWTLNHLFSCLIGNTADDTWVQDMNAGTGSFKNERSNEVFRFLDLMKDNSGANYMDADSTAGFNAFASGEAAMIASGEFSLLNAESVNPDLNVGLFAIPNTDDEADAKLDVDVGICIAVNKKSSHLQETLKVLDYISDNTDKEGWMHCTADTMGAAPAAMEFETQVAAQYYKDYTAYMESGNSKPWIYLQLPSGIADVVGPAVQGYFAGSSDMEQTLQSMDTGCKELLE
jgi:ABC-type sugar transport system, periplasmic component